jgi:hypothetical protein
MQRLIGWNLAGIFSPLYPGRSSTILFPLPIGHPVELFYFANTTEASSQPVRAFLSNQVLAADISLP